MEKLKCRKIYEKKKKQRETDRQRDTERQRKAYMHGGILPLFRVFFQALTTRHRFLGRRMIQRHHGSLCFRCQRPGNKERECHWTAPWVDDWVSVAKGTLRRGGQVHTCLGHRPAAKSYCLHDLMMRKSLDGGGGGRQDCHRGIFDDAGNCQCVCVCMCGILS